MFHDGDLASAFYLMFYVFCSDWIFFNNKLFSLVDLMCKVKTYLIKVFDFRLITFKVFILFFSLNTLHKIPEPAPLVPWCCSKMTKLALFRPFM